MLVIAWLVFQKEQLQGILAAEQAPMESAKQPQKNSFTLPMWQLPKLLLILVKLAEVLLDVMVIIPRGIFVVASLLAVIVLPLRTN
jgi:hypothetical protein